MGGCVRWKLERGAINARKQYVKVDNRIFHIVAFQPKMKACEGIQTIECSMEKSDEEWREEKEGLEVETSDGWSIVHEAAQKGHFSILQYLQECGGYAKYLTQLAVRQIEWVWVSCQRWEDRKVGISEN